MDIKNLTEDAREYARAIIECIDDGVFITDGKANVIELNKRGLGCQKRENIVGKNMRDLVALGIYEEALSIRVIEQKKAITVLQHEETNLLTTAMPYIENGEVKLVVCCERELQELDIMKRQLQESQEKNDKYEKELQYLRAASTSDVGIVYETQEMQDVIDLALTAARFDARVLIEGETGVGKEVIAKYIYRNGARNKAPFIAVNCNAIPETLLESELFGYEKGAFTGANSEGRKGFFELANQGVLFLDEIGDISQNFQAKLLRALQENEIMRVGGKSPIMVDVQVITASNKNLLEKVNLGEFRSDLYYRLNVFPINIPPLRERIKDIIPLTYRFATGFNKKYGTTKEFSLSALCVLQNYDWPGNVRELENVVERIILTTKENIIVDEHVQTLLFNGNIVNSMIQQSGDVSLEMALDNLEKEILNQALKKYKNPMEIEEALKISRATLNRKLKKYNLREE